MPASYSDGVMQFGSQKAAINAVNYIFDTFTIELDSVVTDSNDENGLPNKQYLRRMKNTGSATLQLQALTTPAPPLFSNFSLFPTGANTANAGEAYAFLVKKVSEPSDQNGERKVSIDFVEKLN